MKKLCRSVNWPYPLAYVVQKSTLFFMRAPAQARTLMRLRNIAVQYTDGPWKIVICQLVRICDVSAMEMEEVLPIWGMGGGVNISGILMALPLRPSPCDLDRYLEAPLLSRDVVSHFFLRGGG
jgi:hypothetical protein